MPYRLIDLSYYIQTANWEARSVLPPERPHAVTPPEITGKSQGSLRAPITPQISYELSQGTDPISSLIIFSAFSPPRVLGPDFPTIVTSHIRPLRNLTLRLLSSLGHEVWNAMPRALI